MDLLDLLDDTPGHSQHPPPLDPSPGETLVHLLDLPCAPPAPGKAQQREYIREGSWKCVTLCLSQGKRHISVGKGFIPCQFCLGSL